ncbi:MAG TPA: helix-turn-helix domain-containing protein [Acidimicrobiia bacterium]|nr:helix-turn-helix domain-containing protein [Acidimicrobiia bacterium]
MADRDPAFLWETEVLRASTSSRAAGSTGREGSPGAGGWLTLRQASEATGIPASTLRNWARKGKIPSMLDETPSGPRRMVTRHGVEARARELGHELRASGHTVSGPDVVAAPAPQPAPDQSSPPPGTMLVPIDAWDKMLLQLGNLHQAGQQLAEARERAARAETEAAFLRERLAEYRETVPGRATAPPPPPPAEEERVRRDDPDPAKPVRMPSFTAYLWRMAASGRRRR